MDQTHPTAGSDRVLKAPAGVVHSCITMTVEPGKCDEALEALLSIVGPTLAEPGCVECSILRDTTDDCRICLIEEWATEDDLCRRLRSKVYMSVLLIMEMATRPPSVHFDSVSRRRGIELIHEQRGGAA